MALERLVLGNISVVYERSVFDRRADLRDFVVGEALAGLARRPDRMIVALGGDGTLLRAVRAHSAEALPFLGVHFGNK
jgi:NAD kinase